MINIKPVLHVDDEGHLTAVDKVRGRKKSLTTLVDRMEKQAEGWNSGGLYQSRRLPGGRTVCGEACQRAVWHREFHHQPH